MLFELSGKRKQVLRVVYAGLAILFAVSFVGFGIGSDAAGGIFDAIGLGSGDSSSDNPQFEDQIDEAEATLAEDPKNEAALEDLVRVHYQAGNDALAVDETTQSISMTPEAETEFSESTDAWETYIKVAKKPSEDVAAVVNQAYGVLLQFSEPQGLQSLAEDAVPAAELVAESSPGVGTYATLAQYAYLAGDPKTGDEAAKQASAEAEPSQRKDLEDQLASVKKSAAELEKEIEKQAAKGTKSEAFTNPLEGAGSGSPVTPAPAP